MGYMQDVEQELRQRLADFQDTVIPMDAVVTFVKEKLLESYRNGIAAGKTGATDSRPRRETRRADR